MIDDWNPEFPASALRSASPTASAATQATTPTSKTNNKRSASGPTALPPLSPASAAAQAAEIASLTRMGLLLPASAPAAASASTATAAADPATASSELRLRVFSLNTWLLPPPVVTAPELRIERILKMIRELNPDIVLLQEVWRIEEVARFRRAFPQWHVRSSGSTVYNRGGLLTFSRHPIVASGFVAFPITADHTAVELSAGKGALWVRCRIGHREVTAVNTHLFAPHGERERAITVDQSHRVFALCATLPDPLIVGGDFNLLPDVVQPQYTERFLDAGNNESTVPRGTSVADFENNVARPTRKIDYLLVRPAPGRRPLFESNTVVIPRVSDHAPIVGDITLY